MLQNSTWNLVSSGIANIPETESKRSSHTVNIINEKIYIFGGEHVPRNPIDNELLVYDISSKEWSKIASDKAPISRLGHSSCNLNETLYIFGGRTGIDMGETSLNDLYAFDTKTNTWTQLCEGGDTNDIPDKRSYHTMTGFRNKLYVFGGCSAKGGRLNDLFEYDLDSKKWACLPNDNQIVARGGSILCTFESSDESVEPSGLYLIGGFCGHELDDCYKYEFSTRTWSRIENLPRKLSVFACSSVKNNSKVQMVLHGGEIDPSTIGHNGAGEFSSDTYIYDGKKWSYLNLDPKPTSRGWHASSFDEKNSKFYIYGGNLENNVRSNELWHLSI